MELDDKGNESVGRTRAGDVFHYRWAARRCLKLIQPTSKLEYIVVEGSTEGKKAGEYVLDVSEYYDNSASTKRIEYYQLKHTTKHSKDRGKPFQLGDLKNTIVGFSQRFQQHKKEKTLKGVAFTILTNRRIDVKFKQKISAIIKGNATEKRFTTTLERYTELSGLELSEFCALINLEDSEGDYNVQKEELRIEMAQLQPGSIDTAQADSLITLVQESVLPSSDGKIIKEDILRRFGVNSSEQLFPASPSFEESENITIREVYNDLIDRTTKAVGHVIIEAEGGVGKSIFSQHIIKTLSEGSIGIAYDCFGAGEYRSRSKFRHRHRDALVQISNELASFGYCDPMLVKDTTQADDIIRGFLNRLNQSLKTLRKITSSARVFILIDAADNAEMAAEEFSDACFANELLREEFPEDLDLVHLSGQ